MRYRNGHYQYSEKEMARRIRRLWFQLRWFGGFDVLVTHAPLRGFHDGDDLCHTGFEAFRPLLERYQPKYFLHGHMHMNYGAKTPRLSMYGDTVVINGYRTYDFEYDSTDVRTEAEKLREPAQSCNTCTKSGILAP